jgi:hypothetical protein
MSPTLMPSRIKRKLFAFKTRLIVYLTSPFVFFEEGGILQTRFSLQKILISINIH